ncbi:hypothetical protein AZE42_13518, partial [Rhizopogon vesiculosus]
MTYHCQEQKQDGASTDNS